ncbi:CAP domain-containing protein [Clostridium formicaceticum]|uniref:Cysteine-rich secretory protein family protein n=1 Tax=Clostridium formicaceticum TaxID=1497 RepID=A0AAC9WG00_9CLOT|nr:CAP domain-containing protein [Clostridium formicaceticum]AOY76977.1 hypothetical protein BJL90_14600 [Clostridium formicaceticum]ARE87462.1 Cysteine-rich secretory protein family protein [Clostridium formicaceticum]
MDKPKLVKKLVVPVLTTALLFSTVVTANASTAKYTITNARVTTNYTVRTNTSFNNKYRFNAVRFVRNSAPATPEASAPENNSVEQPQVAETPAANQTTPPPAAPQQQPTPAETQPANPSTPAQNTSNARHALTAAEIEMVEYVNQARKQAGLKPLAIDVDLSYVARVKSKDMQDNNYFSHTSPTYGSPFDMMKNFGIQYRSAAENIAINSSVSGAHNAFMNSEGHRKNILNPNFTHIGIGIQNRHYTQMFIQK